MEAELSSSVAWRQHIALTTSPIIFEHFPTYQTVFENLHTNQSFLHSKKLILNTTKESPVENHAQLQFQEEKSSTEIRRPIVSKKISFKIKKQSSLYKRNAGQTRPINVPMNKVAELTRKFNEMVESRNVWEEEKVKSVEKVSRKPSVKTKPSVTKKNSFKSTALWPNTLNLKSNETSSVKTAIQIFETKSCDPQKPPVPEKSVTLKSCTSPSRQLEDDDFKIINFPVTLPQRRCDSMYETLNLKKIQPSSIKAQSVDDIKDLLPNNSFLWKKSPSSSRSSVTTPEDPKKCLLPDIPPKPSNFRIIKKKMPLPNEDDYEDIVEEKFKGYDEIIKPVTEVDTIKENRYEEIKATVIIDDGYEPIGNQREENFYETLPPVPVIMRRLHGTPLPTPPPRPPPLLNNGYETIYTKKEGHYESIYGSQLTTSSGGSNRDSILSSDQKTNSLYGQSIRWEFNSENTYYKPPSDVSDRSDEWEDITDHEDNENPIVNRVRDRNKGRKTGWSKHVREQLTKSLIEMENGTLSGDEDGHHYESLYAKDEEVEEDYDSFESGTESEYSKDKLEIEDLNDADVQNNKLPDAPQNHQSLMKSAGRNVKKIGRNFTLNLTNTFTRMKKHISKIESDRDTSKKNTMLKPKLPVISIDNGETTSVFEPSLESPNDETTKTLTRNKEGFLTKFRRSMSLSAESANEVTSSLTKTKSTFYLTDTIHVDEIVKTPSPQAVLRHKSPLARPKHPPPPVPLGEPHRKDKTTSWYADSGLFRNKELPPKRPNTCWYAEVGLYRGQNSTPSTSSAENSGSNSSSTIKPIDIDVGRPVLNKSTQDFINHDDNESYNNLKNEDFLYNGSVNSFGSNETKKDESLKQDIQLWLQEEPLYQFYDAALLEATNYSNSSDFDSDNYEDVPPKIKIRPSAMELVSPKRDSICFTKTLWCEIPEVINSAVLSTLNVHQRKLQEAKFEILTSEASYLNSLNVLSNHFYKNFTTGQVITTEERDVLFGNVEAVRNCSEKLLLDLERCWQDNILLHGICKIVQKHAEENFSVYVPYCENQILFDDVLKKLKERSGFTEFLKHLEQSEACQSLTLYSFLMLPMQRITRWPLLIDAVLKRLPENDPEYYTCQYTLATLNKIVSQCNEAARQKERINELLKVAKQLEFPEFMTPIPIVTPERWLVRCGSITHIQLKNEDAKLTFGKRSTKLNLNLFLFNDLFVVAKEKGSSYVVQQYCPRNMVELSTTDVMLTVPAKEVQNKNLIFLTILENHEGKTVEYLFSCNCESDKERWVKALTPPKSENPEEILYECWDCPQVSAIHSYTASQPDELALTKGDVINVLRKMDDGWYHGERLRDGLTGWFPANYTVEIANFHVRARNLKQRYRLLAFSENYLKSK